MHGNEPVGGMALDRLEQIIEQQLIAGSVLTVRANPRAAKLDMRFTSDGRDMNRLWDASNLARLKRPGRHRCYEEQRVGQLAPLLLECDAILDLHSTSRPAPPFILFRDDQRHSTIAVRLGVRRLVTGLHEANILDGGLCSNVGLKPGEYSDRLGFTFEAGQHTNPENAERAFEVVLRLLAVLGMWRDHLPAPVTEPRVYEVTDRFRQTGAGAVPWRFVGYAGGETGGGRSASPRNLESFETVEADEVIMRRGRNQVVRAQAAFTMLMPAPTADPGADLYYVAQRRHGGLGVHLDPRTANEARREALAIERMIDLMEDDEFERGTTLASFDSRHVFDLCAEQILHAMRLPEGHPHRRITVVGRGDWGGDEAERRAGQRYRQAMRLAVVEGLAIDRIQLMRGASLRWLDALTSGSMLDLLQRRAQNGAESNVRVWVSARHPHTVSILVVGDLERALREADTRHVRVALVIEAASAEPDLEDARIRIVRTGLFSARLDFLRATHRVLQALQQEHRHLTRQEGFVDDPAFADVIGEGGAFEATTESEALRTMRIGLRRLQIQQFREALTPLLESDPVQLQPGEEVGRWLVSTMAMTGIRDVDALKALLYPEEDDSLTLDPAIIESALRNPNAFLPPEQPHRSAPPQPVRASEITADTIERWIGWKRFLQGAQRVPDTRGKDIDLAFTEGDIHRHLTRIYGNTRVLARQMPGRVMIVIAGDGQSPTRERPTGSARPVMLAHRALLLDPNVRYLRIQHAQGTHLSWMKDMLETIRQRPADGEPVGLQWEGEHGSSVNVVLVAVRDPDSGHSNPWSLDGWSIEHCGVVVSELEAAAHDYQFAIFTELLPGLEGRINQDLLHFGRAHCQGLLDQGGSRAHGSQADVINEAVVRQLTQWISGLRAWQADGRTDVPASGVERIRWVAEQLGLADHRLARALGMQMDVGGAPEEAALRIWHSVPLWPGPLWEQLGAP